MERLKSMKDRLVSLVEGELTNVEKADTKEVGEAIDMIKDLAEAIYYCKITKAMEKGEEEEKIMSKLGLNNMSYSPMNYAEENCRMYYPRVYEDYPYEYPPYYYSTTNMGGGRRNTYVGGTRRYYTERGNNEGANQYSNGNNNGSRMMSEYTRDYREGRSPMSRRMYMEAKETHKDNATQMKELEKYMSELSSDITEMIQDATPEQKTAIQKKLNTLAAKIQ